jgi:parvulin-like peptidyl-prolyl isomerase
MTPEQERAKKAAIRRYEAKFTEYPGAANSYAYGQGFDAGWNARSEEVEELKRQIAELEEGLRAV